MYHLLNGWVNQCFSLIERKQERQHNLAARAREKKILLSHELGSVRARCVSMQAKKKNTIACAFLYIDSCKKKNIVFTKLDSISIKHINLNI